MRADDLDHAIELQNAGDYALTGGIHSLDEHEVDRWLADVEIGNAYVNRHITGAIVRRQPFGGWKRSSVGGGAKAGGPGYVAQFASITDTTDEPIDAARLTVAMRSMWQAYYCTEHDATGLAAEANVLRYRPLDRVEVRHNDAAGRPLSVLRIAAEVTGVAFASRHATARATSTSHDGSPAARRDPIASGCSPNSTTTRAASCTPPTLRSTCPHRCASRWSSSSDGCASKRSAGRGTVTGDSSTPPERADAALPTARQRIFGANARAIART